MPSAYNISGLIAIIDKFEFDDFLESGLIRVNELREAGGISCNALLSADKKKLIILGGIAKTSYRLFITAEEFDQIRRNLEQARLSSSSPLGKMVLTPFILEDELRSADKIMEEIRGIFEKHKVNLDRVNAVYETAKSAYAAVQESLKPDRRLYYHTLLHAAETALFVARALSRLGGRQKGLQPKGHGAGCDCFFGP